MEFQYTITMFGEKQDSLRENFVKAYYYDFLIYETFSVYIFNANPVFEYVKESLSGVSSFVVEAYSEDGDGYLMCHSKSGECEISYRLNNENANKGHEVIKILMGEEFFEKFQLTKNPSCPIDAKVLTEKELAVSAYMDEIMTGGTF